MAGSRLARGLIALGLALALGASATPTSAQSEGASDDAVQFYRRGREHFRAGRYREAIADLERARLLDPGAPTLVYNLARVHELLGEIERALLYYNEYVRMLPPEEDGARERAVETIRRLEGARETVAPAVPSTPTDEQQTQLDPVVVVQERGVADELFWITAGVSGALLVGGIAVGLSALSAESAAADTVLGEVRSDGTGVNDLEDRRLHEANADDRAIVADVLFAGSVLAAVGAGLLYVLRTEDIETRERYEGTEAFVSMSHREAMVGLRGSL
jgi:tetratricopeptide (TPR) repeat protein